tara:strand:- start:4692 stop:5096 length:405 start_codon:yes stop_codon:yes gene_type:complete
MKTIKQTLFFSLILLGVEAYSQEITTSLEKQQIESPVLTISTDSLEFEKTEYPAINIHDLNLNKAHFQNKGIRHISHEARWEDGFLQQDSLFHSDNNSWKMGTSSQIASEPGWIKTPEKQSIVAQENLIADEDI